MMSHTPIYAHPDGHQITVGQGLITACTAEGIALSMPIGPDGLAALGAALLEHATTAAQEESERAGAALGTDLVKALFALCGRPEYEAFRAVNDALRALVHAEDAAQAASLNANAAMISFLAKLERFEAGPDVKNGGDFGGKAMTYYGRWTYKYEEAARQGAVGFIVIHETAPASYGWATVKNSNTNTMFDVVRDDPAAAHPPLEGWIQRDLAVELFRSAGQDFEALKKKGDPSQAVRNLEQDLLVLRSELEVQDSAMTYTNCLGLTQAAPDRRLYRAFHTTVSLPNPL